MSKLERRREERKREEEAKKQEGGSEATIWCKDRGNASKDGRGLRKGVLS